MPVHRVELFDGTVQGTVVEVMSPYCWRIIWDDGEEGYCHPDGVKHLTLTKGDQSNAA